MLRICQEDSGIVSLQEQFGNIDIYLFDQLLRGRIVKGMRVLDAGCGHGRNLVYLLRAGFDVYGVDADAESIYRVRGMAGTLGANFRVENIERMSFPDGFADVVISNAVLHFARNDDEFGAMLKGMWRVLKPGGMLFCRLASSIGMERQAQRVNGRVFLLPDGSERYLVDEDLLERWREELRGELLDPVKTTVVQNQRAMTTWVLEKQS